MPSPAFCPYNLYSSLWVKGYMIDFRISSLTFSRPPISAKPTSGICLRKRSSLERELSSPLSLFPLSAPECCTSACLIAVSYTHLDVYKRQIKNLINYTRRFFGGRQPLCGTGVISEMERTFKPIDCTARMAFSRPGPGPFTKRSTSCKPNCWAAFLSLIHI